ncbi:unnamed protein product [Pleuronectes platessa]|uniref:Uncharacterized protein n=1 Tax=Pleuronectes platessa TaxID=8262 RepID=A0A9N7YLI4_PLEPL|nr:unnamed protein product [Pleuronectes platessa]
MSAASSRANVATLAPSKANHLKKKSSTTRESTGSDSSGSTRRRGVPPPLIAVRASSVFSPSQRYRRVLIQAPSSSRPPAPAVSIWSLPAPILPHGLCGPGPGGALFDPH